MKIRFHKLTKVVAHIDICCFSGKSTQQIWEFDPGEEIEVQSVFFGQAKKIKTRPNQPGGRLRMARITLKEGDSMHPNYLDNVLETDFEIIER